MKLDVLFNDVKGMVEPYVAKGQEVVTLSYETLMQANGILAESMHSLIKTNVAASKDLLAAAQVSLEKVKSDGLIAAAASPVDYLPDGRERVLSAYAESLEVVSKASGEVVKLVKQGYDTVSARLIAKQVSAPKPRRKAAKKVSGKAAPKAAESKPVPAKATKAPRKPRKAAAAKKASAHSEASGSGASA